MRPLIVAVTICLLGSSHAFPQDSAKGNGAKPPASEGMVIMSGPASTAKIADPNTPIVFNGYVMRVADFAAMVSANSEAVQRLRNQETHNRETAQPTPLSKPSN